MFQISYGFYLLLAVVASGLILDHFSVVSATSSSDSADDWEHFKARFGKNYKSQAEENER
jgi:hypothetical protein